jgi:hypothetical protein
MSLIGNIYAPYFFRPQDAPRYVLAVILMTIFSGLSVLTVLCMKFDLKRENKKLLAQGEQTGVQVTTYTTKQYKETESYAKGNIQIERSVGNISGQLSMTCL